MRSPISSIVGSSLVALALVTSSGTSMGDEGSAAASSPPVTSWRLPNDARWIQGQVNVDAPPDVVWSRLERVDTWPQLLSDIARFRVTDRQGSTWKIELET